MPWFSYPSLTFRSSRYVSPDDEGVNDFDVVLVSGDAYIDHPSFPAAVITRHLQRLGLRVAVICQPDWKSDADFMAWGQPKLFFAIAPGAMDSMVAGYTATGMPRSRDRLSVDGKPGLRPKRVAQVYAQKLRQLYKGAAIILGGVEASMRRFVHYDFWEDRLRDPILMDAPVDLVVYGMGEAVLPKIVDKFKKSQKPDLKNIPQTVIKVKHQSWRDWLKADFVILSSAQECRDNRAAFLKLNTITDTAVRPGGPVLIQQHPKGDILSFPPSSSDFQQEIELMGLGLYNRRSHPIYENPVPALEPVQFSVQSHRGCLGLCTFCALSIHQGRIIRSRTEADIFAEISRFSEHPDFKGVVPDIGGPAVNMYGWDCKIGWCKRNDCIEKGTCENLVNSLQPLYQLLTKAATLKDVRHVFVGSGLRYDLVRSDEWGMFEKIIFNHVSGQLKVAPEHFDQRVLSLMRKGENADFEKFVDRFYHSCNRVGKKLYLVPYLITAFPGCEKHDEVLCRRVKELKLVHEQLQEFTPTPGSLATAMYYTELDLDGKPIKVLKKRADRLASRRKLQNRAPNRPTRKKRPGK